MYTKMVNSSSGGVSRGHLRVTRSSKFSSFLIAALSVGLGILAISYWSLSSQYTALETQLSISLQKADADFRGEQLLHNQLQQKEEEVTKAKVALEKNNQEINSQAEQLNTLTQQLKDLQMDVTHKTQELSAVSQEKQTLQQDKQACEESSKKYQQDLAGTQEEIKRLKSELDLREKAAPIADDPVPSKSQVPLPASVEKSQPVDQPAGGAVLPPVPLPAAVSKPADNDNIGSEDGLDKLAKLTEQLPPPKDNAINAGNSINNQPPTELDKQNLDAAAAEEMSDNRYRLSMDKADQEP